MDALLYLLPALGCAVMMAACMALMGRMHRGRADASPDRDAKVAALRDEVARLRAERDPQGADTDG